MDKIKIIKGDLKSDERGNVRFINDFHFEDVKRFYQVENATQDVVRAFHAHMKEGKYVYVASGSILLCAVFLDDVNNPSKENKVEKFILNSNNPEIVYIPPSFANGFKALEPNTKVIFFSTSTLEQSLEDDYRFAPDYWGDVWQ